MSKYLALILTTLMLSACSGHMSHDDDHGHDEMHDDKAAMEETMEDEAGEEEATEGGDDDEAEEAAEEAAEEVVEEETAEEAPAEEAAEEGGALLDVEVDTEVEVEADTGAAGGRYEAYSTEALASVEGQKAALFFHAGWCGKCEKLDGELEGAVSSWPGGAVFKVDYDTAEELKSQYSVLSQDTVVFLNEDGSVAKMTMGASLDMIAEFLQG